MSGESLLSRLSEVIACGQAGIWIKTNEPEEVLHTVGQLSDMFEGSVGIVVYSTATGPYDYTVGPQPSDGLNGPPSYSATLKTLIAEAQMKAILEDAVENGDSTAKADASKKLAELPDYKIVVVRNAHLEYEVGDRRSVLSLTQQLINLGKSVGYCLVLQSFPAFDPIKELNEDLWQLEHQLPDVEERKILIHDTVKGAGYDSPSESKLRYFADSTGGLTRVQLENICAISLKRNKKLETSVLLSLKGEVINKGGLMRLTYGPEKFKDLGGLQGIKDFTLRALSEEATMKAKGIVVVGPPGSGKSVIARAIGYELGRPTLTLSIGSLMGGIVGDTERNTRQALAIADAMEPCVLMLDEIDKALGGGGEHDSGVNSRLKGTLLTWMSDHRSDVFLVMTANDIAGLPPELTRSGRQDAVFFADMPTAEQRKAIWKIHLAKYGLDKNTKTPPDVFWTGADIEQCCRLSVIWGETVLESGDRVVPTYVRYRDRLDAVRKWANGTTLDAETAKPYVFRQEVATAEQEAFTLFSPEKRAVRKIDKTKKGSKTE